MNSSFAAVFTFQETLGSAALNAALNGDYDLNVVATGSDQGTAYQIAHLITLFTTVGAGSGAVLPNYPSAARGFANIVLNRGSHNLTLYPFGAGTIEGVSSKLIPPGAIGWVFIGGQGIMYLA